MNPEGTWYRRGAKSAVTCQMSWMSVCVAPLLRHLRDSRRASWYIIQLQSLFCMPNQKNQPSVRTCHSALSKSGHLETFAHSAANLTANYFHILSWGI